FKSFAILSATMMIISLIALSLFFGMLYFGGDSPDMSKLQTSQSNLIIKDCQNNVIIDLKDEKYVDSAQIPRLLSDAFVAVEDKRFYSHNGIDYFRIAGAMINNIKGNRTQGASTITQQLAKNIYYSSEQTFSRKFKEMQTAIKLEKMLSKEEILEYYLNMLYFGSGEYGVKNAALRFFDKSLDELNALECAMLAGIVKSPTKYNPINNYSNSIDRARIVLRLMREQDMITDDIYQSYKSSDIIIKNALIENNQAKIYLSNAKYEACKILNIEESQLLTSGYTISTFYDPSTQRLLSSSIFNNSYYSANDDSSRGIGIICDNNSLGIKALSSRENINIFEFKRQVGSTIKPLACYAPALDQGIISPYTKILDEPTSFGNYSPSNFRDKYYGWTSVNDCVEKSLNIPSVKILQQLGPSTSRNYLAKMNIVTDEQDDNLALALGGTTYGMSMIDLLGGYSTLSNGGLYSAPTFIKTITDKDGNIIYDYKNNIPVRVFDEQSAYLMTNMLINTTKTGTAKKLSNQNYQIACKTGTVSMENKNFNSDIYSVGYTSQDTFLFWQGGTLTADQTGGGATTLMCKNFLDNYYTTAPQDFVIPNGIIQANIDKYAYEHSNEVILASQNAPKSSVLSGVFSEKCLPKDVDNTYDHPAVDDLLFEQNLANVSIKFTLNPKLSYRIYKRDFIKGETLIYDIKNSFGDADYQIEVDRFFGNTITVVPYYIDDDSKEIIGTPSKFNSNSIIPRINIQP
ncbi:MAG: transglycosylase domain-containing protein, partial [Clostridia bacterium]|nr:transglycosylase domain-containing protein [Clostridia bacterium]